MVWPKTGFRAKPNPSPTLVAANGTSIKTYGARTLKLNLGGIKIAAKVTLADVRAPMLGWDWFHDKRAQILLDDEGYKLAVGNKKVKLTNMKADKKWQRCPAHSNIKVNK